MKNYWIIQEIICDCNNYNRFVSEGYKRTYVEQATFLDSIIERLYSECVFNEDHNKLNDFFDNHYNREYIMTVLGAIDMGCVNVEYYLLDKSPEWAV